MALADSLASNEEAVAASKGALTTVLMDLKDHAPGFDYDYRDETAMLAVEKLPAAASAQFLADSMMTYEGTRDEIAQYVDRLRKRGADFTPTLELAERVADKNQQSLCFVAGSYKPGGKNEIGVTFVFAEETASDAHAAQSCFYLTFMGAFGLSGRLPGGSKSTFSDDNVGSPTSDDWLLWRLHEDPALHFGMTVDQARVVVSHILAQK